MKRSTFASVAFVLVMFLGGTTALMQHETKIQPSEIDLSINEAAQITDSMPQTYINRRTRHKLILGNSDEDTYLALRSKNAILDEIDYGSFKLVVIDEGAVGGRAELMSVGAPVRDDQNLIALNTYILDTTEPESTYNGLPADLKEVDISVAPRKGLYLVQFIGPIKDEWLDALKATGARMVSFMPSNAYVVKANRRAAARLAGLTAQHPFVQFVGNYEPAFKLSPALVNLHRRPEDALVEITVQVIDGFEAQTAMDNLRSLADEVAGSAHVLNYHNVRLKVRASRLAEIARMDSVFALEERLPIARRDEAQGQILAGNLLGNAPAAPGYLDWLASKGFTSSQFGSFAVNVVDDATSITGHPDLASGRVAFQNNPTNQTGSQGGHGFLNAHIVGGFNSGAGSAVEDLLGFNYGLGIAPFARMGATAIFGATGASPSTWESTAYGQGARISSNSWGFSGTSAFRYDSNAQTYDRIVRDAQTGTAGLQQMTVVFAAGNDGPSSNTVGTPATAKNIICVGAGENVRQTGTDGCGVGSSGADSANDIIGFSSRGPVNPTGGDGRVKPDIMGPGTHVEAGIPQSNYAGNSICNAFFPAGQTLYGWSSGTSHSCPAVAGGAALVYQHFLNSGLPVPSPAMVKAYLMNSATHMTGVGANDSLFSNNQGMGRMNLGRAFDGAARMMTDQTQVLGATGETVQVTGSVSTTSQPFRVTLAWTDAPGPTTGAPWVNNLDLEVTIGGTTFRGNVFSGANSVAGGSADGRNNVESVFIPAGVSGNFTVTVRATNIAGDGVPGNADTTDQDFALLIYNATPEAGGGDNPPPVAELIVNGGFEGSITPWVLSGQALRSTGGFPHSGTGYLILNGTNSSSGSAFQQISIPAGVSPNLTFFLNITSSETTTITQFDRLFVEVRNTSGTLLSTLGTFSNLNKGTAGAYVQRGPFNLSGFSGQTIRVQFRGTTDSSLISTFRIDDVSVQ